MINAMEKGIYKAFGLTIYSEIPLPELFQNNAPSSRIDIFITKKDLTKLWLELASPDEYFVVKENLVMFHIPEIATFLITNGSEIFVSSIGNYDEDCCRLYILGTCMGAILMQRKILPLHGSAIAINGKAYAIVGNSGAGKSTLAKAFLNRGYQLISDDVVPVTFSENQVPLVTPSYPQQKLWIESLNHFGLKSEPFKPLMERETKFSVPVSSQFVNEQLPLAGIYELIKIENEDFSIIPVKGMERFYTLFNHTYRNFFLPEAGLMEWHFETSAKLINKISLYKIQRPTTRFTAYDLTELILSTINEQILTE